MHDEIDAGGDLVLDPRGRLALYLAVGLGAGASGRGH